MIKQVCSIFFRSGQKYFGVGDVTGEAKKFLLLGLQHNSVQEKRSCTSCLINNAKKCSNLHLHRNFPGSQIVMIWLIQLKNLHFVAMIVFAKTLHWSKTVKNAHQRVP